MTLTTVGAVRTLTWSRYWLASNRRALARAMPARWGILGACVTIRIIPATAVPPELYHLMDRDSKAARNWRLQPPTRVRQSIQLFHAACFRGASAGARSFLECCAKSL